MKVIISCFLLLNILTNIQGQNTHTSNPKLGREKMDSLKEILQRNPTDFIEESIKVEKQWLKENKEDLLIELYHLQVDYLDRTDNYDLTILTLHKFRQLVGDKDEMEIAYIYLQLASTFCFMGNIDSLNYWQSQAEKFRSSTSSLYGNYLLVDGLKNSYLGKYSMAIKSLWQAISFFEKIGNKKGLAVAYNNLAANYGRLGDLENQKLNLLKAIDINKSLGYTYQMVMNYNNLGSNYKQSNQIEKALKYYDLAYQELKKLDNPFLLAQNLTNRANIFEKQGNLKAAEKFFAECEKVCEENNIQYGVMLTNLNMGNLFRLQKKYVDASLRLNKSLALTKSLNSVREEALVYERLSWLSRDIADFKAAYDFQTKFHLLNDSLINESVKKEAFALKEKYESEKKEKEILKLSKKQLNYQYFISILFGFVLLLLIVIQWWRNKHKLVLLEKQKQELNKKLLKDVIENKEKELTSQVTLLAQMQQQVDELIQKTSKILNDNSTEQVKLKKIETLLKADPIHTLKNDFDVRLTSNNEDFFSLLLHKYPDLSPAELKLCAYLRLNPSTKDLALITNRSMRTIESTRTNIRKKMNLTSQENLVTHLLSFSNE
jgi:tetratricopeptide (TPR) repeat protein